MSEGHQHLASAIHALGLHIERAVDLLRSDCRLVTKADLGEMENRIMSAISEFKAKQDAHNERVESAITGLQADIQALNDKITELQNSPGAITPEDQALLDDLESKSENIAAKLEALDALTPPKPPV